MAELWYSLIMSFSGVMTLTGIFITWLIGRKIECMNGSKGFKSYTLLLGGLLTSLGFSYGILSGKPLSGFVLFIILLGPALIGYGLLSLGFTNVSGRLIIQSTLLILSLLGAGEYSTVAVDIAYVGPFLAMLLLINTQITLTNGLRRNLLIASSWLIVVFSWTRYLLDDTGGVIKGLIVIPYFISVAIWVGVLASLYFSGSATFQFERDHKTGQEGL